MPRGCRCRWSLCPSPPPPNSAAAGAAVQLACNQGVAEGSLHLSLQLGAAKQGAPHARQGPAATPGGPQRIPMHCFRLVLAISSAIFNAMFPGGMASTLAEIVQLTFLELLRCLCSDEVQTGPATVMTSLHTAKKYAVPALEAHCVIFPQTS